ncbi:diacylglycerol/polyprenol kinase family protein [Mariniphaga sp.]|uniref:diacylglycerol/polyprenol kinase family protein n=1 Tax=Mariniphaga sp. TaxID=1954475 RepID=UPI003564A1F5
MGNQIGLTVIYMVAIALLLVFNELVYRRLGLKGEITRKFAHFTATLSTITFPYLFDNHWYVLFMAVAFFILLFVSRHRTYLKSIHDIQRISIGSYLLPVSIYLTFLVSHKLDNKFLFILPILVLAICDPVAGILGINLQQYNHKIKLFGHELQKTWLGSLSFFVSCFIISLIALYFNQEQINLQVFLIAFTVAFVSTIAEMLSWKGSDNMFIPMSVLLVLVILL